MKRSTSQCYLNAGTVARVPSSLMCCQSCSHANTALVHLKPSRSSNKYPLFPESPTQAVGEQFRELVKNRI